MKVLIIGASGFIGSACFRSFSKTHASFGIGSTPINDKNFLVGKEYGQTDAFIREHQPDVIINCAGSSNIQQSFLDPTLDHELNTVLVQRILESLKNYSSHTKFINLSSAAVYGNPQHLPVNEKDLTAPLSPYGKNKLLSEELMKSYATAFGLKTLSLRIFSAFGIGLKRQFFYDLSKKFISEPEGIVIHGTGKESRDFIYIDDIVRAFELLMTQPVFNGQVMNLASGVETIIEDAANSYATFFGYKGKIDFNHIQLKGYPLNWKADVSKIQGLGFKPNISLEQGMKNYANWLKPILQA